MKKVIVSGWLGGEHQDGWRSYIQSSTGLGFKEINLRIILLILVASFLISGCNLPAREALPEEGASETEFVEDLSALATLTQIAVAGNISQLTETIPATEAQNPTLTPTSNPPASSPNPDLPQQKEIRFRTGGTMAVIQEQIRAGDKHTYLLQAAAGQTMILGVSSNNVDAYLGLIVFDSGQTLIDPADQAANKTLKLPATRDYQISVFCPTDNTYSLIVEIPALVEVSVGGGPVALEGYLDVLDSLGGYESRIRYLVEAEAGQRLIVEQTGENITFALSGKTNQEVYIRHPILNTSLEFEIPETQSYYLDVYAVSGQSTEYTLSMELTE
jgi:hypothetical protein